jgi:hypothetical protein
MTQYICEECNKCFSRKINLEHHIEKGACKVNEFHCPYCKKEFTTQTNMYRHVRTSCIAKREVDKNKGEIYVNLLKMEQKFDDMKKRNDDLEEKMMKRNEDLENEIKKLKEDMINVNMINVNNNKGTVNQIANQTINVIVVGYGMEDMTKLNQSEILRALQSGYYSTVKLTEAVHFNPKFPEYHNIYISNMRDKYAMMLDGKKWCLTTKEDLINKIYEDKKNYIEENLDTFVASLSISRRNALKRWLDADDEDPKISDIKENIKLLLYNSKETVLNKIKKGDDQRELA